MSNFICQHCGKEFVREHAFLNHKCEAMIRLEIMKTPRGLSGLKWYQLWMKKNNRGIPSVDTFMSSRLFHVFCKFADFVKRVKMPSPEGFIELMTSKDIHPNLWTNDKAYSLFIEQHDKHVPVLEQVETSINTLFAIAEYYECEIHQVFINANPSEILELIKIKQLTPWLLLNSPKFIAMISKRFNFEQRKHFNTIVRVPYWKLRFNHNKQTVETIKKFIREMNL